MQVSFLNKTLTFFSSMMLVVMSNWTVAADPPGPSQVPLYLAVVPGKPNIMLMVDTSGSMSTTVATDPAKRTRMVIAKEAATNVVTKLTPTYGNPTVRLGLATYNASVGGKLLYPVADLDANHGASLKSKIATFSPSGYTPLATTLSDIGYYFATRATDNATGTLTLHPGTPNASTKLKSELFTKTDSSAILLGFSPIDNCTYTTNTTPVTPCDMPGSTIAMGCPTNVAGSYTPPCNCTNFVTGGADTKAAAEAKNADGTLVVPPIQMLVVGGQPVVCTSTSAPYCANQNNFRMCASCSNLEDCPTCSDTTGTVQTIDFLKPSSGAYTGFGGNYYEINRTNIPNKNPSSDRLHIAARATPSNKPTDFQATSGDIIHFTTNTPTLCKVLDSADSDSGNCDDSNCSVQPLNFDGVCRVCATFNGNNPTSCTFEPTAHNSCSTAGSTTCAGGFGTPPNCWGNAGCAAGSHSGSCSNTPSKACSVGNISNCYDNTCSGICTNNNSLACDITNTHCQTGTCDVGSNQGFCSNDTNKKCGTNKTCYLNYCKWYPRCTNNDNKTCANDSECYTNSCNNTLRCSGGSNRTAACSGKLPGNTCNTNYTCKYTCSNNSNKTCDSDAECNSGISCDLYAHDRCSHDYNTDCNFNNDKVTIPDSETAKCNTGVTCQKTCSNNRNTICTNFNNDCKGSCTITNCTPSITCDSCSPVTPDVCTCTVLPGLACAVGTADITIGTGTVATCPAGSNNGGTGGTLDAANRCFNPSKYYTVQYNGSIDIMGPYRGDQLNWYFHANTGFIEGSIELPGTTNTETNCTVTNAPIQNWCQKSFAVLISDGLPNQDRKVNNDLKDYTGHCAASPSKCVATETTVQLPSVALTGSGTGCDKVSGANNTYCKNGTKVGRKYESGGSDYLDDVANALYDMDLRPDFASARAAANAPASAKSNLVTYTIGFADPGLSTNSILNDAAVLGGGKFFFADDAAQLAAALDNVISDIASRAGASASVAANSTRVDTGTLIYQGKFDSGGWFGSLNAFPLDFSTGDLQTEASWDAAKLIPNHADRVILTYDPTNGNGTTFTCNNLSATQKSALGIVGNSCSGSFTNQGPWRVDYIRGDKTHEVVNPNRKFNTGTEDRSTDSAIAIFRNRTYLDPETQFAYTPDPWVLGDIINSNPIYAGNKDNYGYKNLPEGGYSDYLTLKSNYRSMLYVGANDGMLHGFDAVTGVEQVAYIPNAVYGNLQNFTNTNYSHRYFVDGSPTVGDAYFDDNWHTVMIGTTGAGGKAVFAMDVTNPQSFASSNVLWEVDNTTSGFTNLGYTMTKASVVRMKDDSWVAAIGNGYYSANKKSVLYLIDVKTGAVVKAIEATNSDESGFTSNNGLSTPFVADINRDKIADYIYAGDLRGNLWKFDVTNENPTNWIVANAGKPLYVACDIDTTLPCPENQRQPITTIPMVGEGETANTYMVYFGTGKYFESADNNLTSPQKQTFYGIKDYGVTVPTSGTTTRSNLVEQTITPLSGPNDTKWRTSSDNGCENDGWFMDLPSNGERVIAAPKLHMGRIIFVTLIPSAATDTQIANCAVVSNGTGWLMELSAQCGTPLDTPPWDTDGDGDIDDDDLIDGKVPSGRYSKGIPTSPAIVRKGDKDIKVFTDSDAEMISFDESRTGEGNPDTGGTRETWRQIR